jgi:hypothetical protein
VVEEKPNEKSTVVMHNQASNQHRAEALPLKSLSDCDLKTQMEI